LATFGLGAEKQHTLHGSDLERDTGSDFLAADVGSALDLGLVQPEELHRLVEDDDGHAGGQTRIEE